MGVHKPRGTFPLKVWVEVEGGLGLQLGVEVSESSSGHEDGSLRRLLQSVGADLGVPPGALLSLWRELFREEVVGLLKAGTALEVGGG